jgi:predicted ArsR family transcriptional regulator
VGRFAKKGVEEAMETPAALRIPTQLKILQSLRARPRGFWTLDELAASHHVDRTVAFEHLEMLVAARLATKQKLSRGRGRPMNAYRYAAAKLENPGPPQRSQLLAMLLAQSLDMSPGGAEDAHRVGHEFGRSVGTVDLLGGEYVIDDLSVHALSCMFESSCASARQVVCGLHAGLIEGAMAATGSKSVVTPAGPDGLGGCVFHLGSPGPR